MKKTDLWNDVPHNDVIVENETVTVPSIFMFTGGPEELFPFLIGCREKNCTVWFENEDITVAPKEDSYQNVLLSLYATLAATPSIPTQYMRYVFNLDKMVWPKSVSKEVIQYE